MSKKNNLIILSSLIIFSIYCAFQLGYTWDAMLYYEVGKERLDYLLSLGSNEVDKSIFSRRFVPGAYSTISAFFVQFFPRSIMLEGLYLINLCFSLLAVFGIYRVTKELFNKEVAKITFLICFFNPIFFGHMSMNSIDTIITFANIWVFYEILRYLKHQQNKEKRKNYVLYCGLFLGLGVGVRYSFFITLVPIFLFCIAEIFYFKYLIGKNFSKKFFFIDVFKVLLISYFIMVFFWPHTHSNIFLEPFKLVLESFSFGFGHPFMLFDGEIYRTLELPKKYILVNLLYKMPEFIVISFVIFFLFYIKLKKNYEVEFKNFNFRILLIFAIILFPNLLNIVNPYGIYDGLRLFLFIIPYISIIPAILIFFLYKNIKNNLYKFTFVLIILLKVFFLFNFFTLTPYHYVYLNIFAGKYSENWKKFENDYWGVSTKKLISSIKNHKDFFEDKSIKIAVCGLPARAQEIYLRKIKNLKFKMVSKDEKFDYMIMNNRVFLDKENKSFDPKMARSCFQKFSGEDLIKIERRGLVIAKITKI